MLRHSKQVPAQHESGRIRKIFFDISDGFSILCADFRQILGDCPQTGQWKSVYLESILVWFQDIFCKAVLQQKGQQ